MCWYQSLIWAEVGTFRLPSHHRSQVADRHSMYAKKAYMYSKFPKCNSPPLWVRTIWVDPSPFCDVLYPGSSWSSAVSVLLRALALSSFQCCFSVLLYVRGVPVFLFFTLVSSSLFLPDLSSTLPSVLLSICVMLKILSRHSELVVAQYLMKALCRTIHL